MWGGRSVPSTGCTWPTARAAAGRWPAAPPSRGKKARGSGGTDQRTREWRIGHLIAVLKDKAEAAGSA